MRRNAQVHPGGVKAIASNRPTTSARCVLVLVEGKKWCAAIGNLLRFQPFAIMRSCNRCRTPRTYTDSEMMALNLKPKTET